MLDKIFVLVFRIFALPVYAADEPKRLGELIDMLYKVFEKIFPVGGILVTLMLIYGGFMWISSGGDPNKKQQAQAVLTWAVIGLVFLILTRAIMLFISGFISA